MRQQQKVSFIVNFAKELTPILLYFTPFSNIHITHIWKRESIIIVVIIHLYSNAKTLKKCFWFCEFLICNYILKMI